MMVQSPVHNQPSVKQRSMPGGPLALRSSRLRLSSRNICAHGPLCNTCIPRSARSLSGRRDSRPRRGGRQRGLTPNASLAAGARSSSPSMAPSRAPVACTLAGRPDRPRLADPQRGQAGRRHSWPGAASLLRTARLSTYHPRPWLIIHISRSREREQKIPSPWRGGPGRGALRRQRPGTM